MMFRYSLLLTGIFLVFALFSTVVTQYVSKQTLRLAAERQRYIGKLTATVEEAYSGRLIYQSFNREELSAAKVQRLSDKLARASRRADFATNAISPLIRFISAWQVLIAIVAGGMLVGGRITIGVFQAFFHYIYQVLQRSPVLVHHQRAAERPGERRARVRHPRWRRSSPTPPPMWPRACRRKSRGASDFGFVRFGYAPGEAAHARCDVPCEARPEDRHRGRDGCRQDDAHQPAPCVLRDRRWRDRA